MLITLIILGWILSGWLGLYIGYSILKDFEYVTLGMVVLFGLCGPSALIAGISFCISRKFRNVVLFKRK